MSKIQWTEKTWNPITGCTKVSEGCAHCYAEGVANRFWGDRKFGDVQFHPDRLNQPLRRKKPTMYFVNSMSDLFHEAVTDEHLDQIFAVMALTQHHTYQVLTKRPERMLEYFREKEFMSSSHLSGRGVWASEMADFACENLRGFFWVKRGGEEPSSDHVYDPLMAATSAGHLPNCWLGVTCENQRTADERIPLLLQTPAAVRFLSCEPLLEDIDLRLITGSDVEPKDFIHWVIVGGESGAKARPCDIGWIRSIVEQCKEAEVPCFVKQLGSKPVTDLESGYPVPWHPSTGKGGNPEEWPEDLRVREYPKTLQPT